jgi:hypothetical protein
VIEVYDVATLNHRRNVSIPGLRCVIDLASCPQCDVVYISDDVIQDIRGRQTWSRRIQLVCYGLATRFISEFTVQCHRHIPNLQMLREFTPRGELIRNITLQSDIIIRGMPFSWTTIGTLLYTVTDDSLHRVCIVNRNGTLIESYGGDRGSGVGQLNTPYRMLIFGGSMIVADRDNKRLLLFSVSPLQYTRELISTYSEGLLSRTEWQSVKTALDSYQMIVLHALEYSYGDETSTRCITVYALMMFMS